VFLPKPGDLAPVEHARGAFLHAAFRSWWSAPELVPDALLAHLAPLGRQEKRPALHPRQPAVIGHADIAGSLTVLIVACTQKFSETPPTGTDKTTPGEVLSVLSGPFSARAWQPQPRPRRGISGS
jgi:hypothetical protein